MCLSADFNIHTVYLMRPLLEGIACCCRCRGACSRTGCRCHILTCRTYGTACGGLVADGYIAIFCEVCRVGCCLIDAGCILCGNEFCTGANHRAVLVSPAHKVVACGCRCRGTLCHTRCRCQTLRLSAYGTACGSFVADDYIGIFCPAAGEGHSLTRHSETAVCNISISGPPSGEGIASQRGLVSNMYGGTDSLL